LPLRAAMGVTGIDLPRVKVRRGVVSPFPFGSCRRSRKEREPSSLLSPVPQTARLPPPYRSRCESDSCVERAARASKIAAVCDLVGARTLVSIVARQYGRGSVRGKAESPGSRRRSSPSPSGAAAAQAPAAGGRASDAHSGSPQRVTPPLDREPRAQRHLTGDGETSLGLFARFQRCAILVLCQGDLLRPKPDRALPQRLLEHAHAERPQAATDLPR